MIEGLILILYSINFNIFLRLYNDFGEGKSNSFFRMLDHHKINAWKFMSFYQSLMFRSTFVFIILGIILVIR